MRENLTESKVNRRYQARWVAQLAIRSALYELEDDGQIDPDTSAAVVAKVEEYFQDDGDGEDRAS